MEDRMRRIIAATRVHRLSSVAAVGRSPLAERGLYPNKILRRWRVAAGIEDLLQSK